MRSSFFILAVGMQKFPGPAFQVFVFLALISYFYSMPICPGLKLPKQESWVFVGLLAAASSYQMRTSKRLVNQ